MTLDKYNNKYHLPNKVLFELIEINEENLIRIGFKELSKNYLIIECDDFSFSCYYSSSGGVWKFEIDGKVAVNIKYINDIQNLYFCLSKKELLGN
jgi:hypothetical protein